MGDATYEEFRRILSATPPRSYAEETFTQAGVLLALYAKGRDLHILLTKRTSHVEHHKGEISFPGGGMDADDSDVLATALRESREELGIDPGDVQVLGRLDQEPTRTGFLITPFVGIIPYPYALRPSTWEVDEVLEVPVSHLLNPAFSEPEERWIGPDLVQYRSYHFNGHIIWGATARILTGFLDRVGEGLQRR